MYQNKPRITSPLALFVLTSLCANPTAFAQSKPEMSYRVAYANDQFNGTDCYFTAGLEQSIGTDRLRIGLSQAMYSPCDISDASLRVGDRPYASTALLSMQSHHFGKDTASYWISTVSIGKIGSSVGGEQIQRMVHRAVGVAEPAGWQHQIERDWLIGAQVNYVRQLLRRPWLEADAGAELKVGSLQTRFGMDSRLAIGPRNVRLFLGATGFAPVYDATLQGGVYNRNSPLRYRYQDLRPLVGKLEIGLKARVGRWSGFASQILLTPEMRQGKAHAWIVCGGELRW